MASINEILNFAVPALLIAIVIGWLYTKLIGPYVMPLLTKLWESLKGKEVSVHTRKEITFE